jgi:DNA-binding NarL/FixJ family response regulator
VTSRAIDELRRELDTVAIARPQITREHVTAAQSLIGADVFGYFTFDAAGGLDALAFSGLSAAVTTEYRRGVRTDRTWGFVDPSQVPVRQQNRLVTFQARQFLDGETGTLRRLGMPNTHYRRVVEAFREHMYPFYRRNGFEDVWQLRAVLAVGSRLVGWVGALFERRPMRAQAATLATLMPSLVARAHHARRLALGASKDSLVETLLELQPGACYLVTSSGEVSHANRAGREALSGSRAARDELRNALANPRAATGYEVFAVEGGMHIARATAELSLNISRFRLTPRQAEVARALPTGATNRDIARMLGMSERTVEVHLTAIYERLDVDGRSAAVAKLLRGR